jgi:hypothetical protein
VATDQNQTSERPTAAQEAVDRFYWSHGSPCCAGCDWWRHFNSVVGECLRSAPVGQGERWAMVGIEWSSLRPGAGHIATPRDHRCGDFEDSFDWTSLAPVYRRRIGIPAGKE